MASPQSGRWLGRMATTSGALVALVGAGYLVAWFSGYMVYRGFSTITMKTNTALALLLAGLGLVLLASPQAGLARRLAGRGLAAFTALLGLLSLGENLLGWNLGIDQLLAREAPGAMAVGAPNLMGTPAATSFLLAGLALLILCRRDHWGAKAMQGLALAVCMIAMLGTIGYLYGAQDFYAIARYTGIALPTALALLLLGLGQLLARPTDGLMAQVTADDPGGANLRRWLPVLLLPVALGWFRIFGERLGLFDAATGTAMMMIIFIGALAVLAYTGARQVSRSSAALQRQREWLRVTLASIGDAVIATDTAGKVTFLNPVAEGLTGWKEQEILGHPVHEVFRIINERTREQADDIVTRVLREGCIISLANQTAIQARDGREIPIEDSAAPILDAAGKVSGVVIVFHDVNEKRRAQEALRVSEQKYRTIIETAGEGIALAEPDGPFIFVNNRMAKMLGYGIEEILGKSSSDFMFEPHQQQIVLDAKEKLHKGEAVTGEFQFRRKDGSALWTLYHATATFDANGVHTGNLALYLDVTERKQTEEALRESEDQYRRIVETAIEGIWVTTSEMKTSYVNRRMAEMLGYLPEEMIGRSIEDFMDDEGRTHAAKQFNRRRQGIMDSDEQKLICKDGSSIWVTTSGSPLTDKDGRFSGSFAMLSDITERKRMEDELRQSRSELERRVHERTKELSQSIRVLSERSEQLRRMTAELALTEQRERKKLAQVLHDGLQQILVGAKFLLATVSRNPDVRQATDQVAELIDDALETSRSLTAELSPPILHQGDLYLALEWLVRWMHVKYELNINLTAHEKVGPLAEGVLLLLFQAARELLFNIVKHAGVKAARLEVNQVDGQILMTIEDEGSGFDPDRLRAEGGQSGGMGLFGINERLSYLGGRMEITSAPGRGSRFNLMVPYASVPEEMDRSSVEKQMKVSIAVSPQLQAEAAGTMKKIRIALVDDHLVVRQGLAGLLRMESDFEIAGEASDGEAGVYLIREIRPDVVLMDVSMPGMDGIQATRIIHKESPETRIIGLSMFQAGEKRAAMHEAGAVNYLTKSGPAEELIQAIRDCVRVPGESLADKPVQRADQKIAAKTTG